jgi:hypothetical protein
MHERLPKSPGPDDSSAGMVKEPFGRDDMFRLGFVRTDAMAPGAEPTPPEAQCLNYRKIKLRQLYAAPSDSWRQVLGRAQACFGRQGEYRRPQQSLEVWTQHGDGTVIESSTPLGSWPRLSRQLRQAARPTMGLLAVRTDEAGEKGYPGLTVVLETPSGGAAGAFCLMGKLGEHGIGGCLACAEHAERWGVVKLIYPPHWYATNRDTVFKIHWRRWLETSRDWNENKRFWFERATLAILEALKDLPSACCDSLFFDEYAASDRLGLVSDASLKRLFSSPAAELAEELIQLNSEPISLGANPGTGEEGQSANAERFTKEILDDLQQIVRKSDARKRGRRQTG